MRHPRAKALSASLFAAALVAAPAAHAAPVTIDWKEPSKTTSSINAGEAVTWNVVEGGHNVDVTTGPETFKSTNGTDKTGTQFTHVFNTPGTYSFICDYHGGMKGTITVAAAQPAQGGGGGAATGGGGTTPQTAPGGSAAQPQTGAPAGPAGAAASNNGVDAAAPTVQRVSVSRSTLKLRLSEPAKLTIRYRKQGAKKVATKVVSGRQGTNAIKLAKLMRNGSYRVSVVATDAAGNVSKALRLSVRR
jgi:plastocyanin